MLSWKPSTEGLGQGSASGFVEVFEMPGDDVVEVTVEEEDRHGSDDGVD